MAQPHLTIIVTVGILLNMVGSGPPATSKSVEAAGLNFPARPHARDDHSEIKLAKRAVKTRSYRTKKALPECVTAEEIARRNLINSGVMPRVLQSCR